MSDFLNIEEREYLICAWMNFKTVLESLPSSQIRDFLMMGLCYLLEKLSDSLISRSTICQVTRDINKLIQHSPMVLDIDDVLTQVNMAAFVCSAPEEAFYVS